jgi:hypothetical protein
MTDQRHVVHATTMQTSPRSRIRLRRLDRERVLLAGESYGLVALLCEHLGAVHLLVEELDDPPQLRRDRVISSAVERSSTFHSVPMTVDAPPARKPAASDSPSSGCRAAIAL